MFKFKKLSKDSGVSKVNNSLIDKGAVGFKDFSKYVSMNILGLLAFNCYILADTFFVANGIGLDALTALNLALPVFGFINGFGMMFGMGGATRLAVLRAKGENSDKPFFHSLILAVLLGVIFVLIGAFATEKLAVMMGATGNILPLTVTYMQVLLYFSPAFFINNVVMCYTRNDGAPVLAMIALATGSLSNVLLDYIFIMPLGMGMFGAILATGLAPIISLVLLSFHWISRKSNVKFKPCKLEPKMFGSIISLGFFSFVSEISNGITILLFNLVILSIAGDIGIAAYGIVANIFLVALGFFNGVSQGMQPLVSKCYGSKDTKQMKKLYKYGVATALIIAVVIYVLVATLAEPIIGIFNKENNAELIEIATLGMMIYFVSLIFSSFNIVTAGFFGATEKSGKAFLISVLRGLVCVIPLLYLMSYLLGMTGVWLSLPIAEAMVFVVSLTLVLLFLKKLKTNENSIDINCKNV
ncbi:MAG: MATE family efflux transporter [Clostridia bacterium]